MNQTEAGPHVQSKRIRALQIFSGLGAGNIGDEFMARAFWQQLSADTVLDVIVDSGAARQHAPYPLPHRYLVRGRGRQDLLPGLVVGTTPVTEDEGVGWPLEYLAGQLRPFHRQGVPVDAVAVGVDLLHSAPARRLFREAFHPIRSWTVRSPRCQEALVAMGVSPECLRIGADLAWLYRSELPFNEWAAAYWRQIGIDPERPLLVANLVNLRWRDRRQVKRNIAAALDAAAVRMNLQLAFFCNECRDGAAYDFAAASDVAAMLRRPAVLVPNRYYSPDETLALLRRASVTVGQRYHFIIESILAGVTPVAILRGQKMQSLVEDTQTPVGGRIDGVDADILATVIEQALAERTAWSSKLPGIRERMAIRARPDLVFVHELARHRS
ncbi:MAG: polysaccharide pyruvyl transferase family protein [Acidobacteriota bacterium]